MKNRNHIDSKTLAQAAKWSKPKLRKKYTYKPKKITVSKYLKDSNDSKLQHKYAKYLTKSKFKKKSTHTDDDNNKVYNKFESKNNFANLKQQNMEFAMSKNKQRKFNRLKKLDNLAWESITIPSNDNVFGSLHGTGNECGVGALQVIDSKQFFDNINMNELNVEEYVLDNNYYKHNDNIGITKELNINQFNNEANELLTLIQFSVNKLNKQNQKLIHNKKRLHKRKTMKEKSEQKRLKMLEKRYGDSMLIKTQNEIDDRMLDLLGINLNSLQKQLKMDMKIKSKQHKMKQVSGGNVSDEPPLKKRKLNNKKTCEFRHQMDNLHEKQNITQISKNWNELLLNETGVKNDCNNDELLLHLKIKTNVIEILSNNELDNYLIQCVKSLVVIVFMSENMDSVCEYGNDIDILKINVNKMDDNIGIKYNINKELLPVFVFINGKTKQEIKRINGDMDNDMIVNEINNLLLDLNKEKRMLHGLLLRGISDLGFIEPTNIQKEVIPIGINGMNDVLISAATGSGKTLSFGIPIINDLLYCSDLNVNNGNVLDSYLYGLIITPTRELAIQIESHLKLLCKYSSISCGLIIGGMSLLKQQRILKLSPEIIIGTPGRIWNLIKDNLLSSIHLRNLIKLRYLVLDEADKLLCSKHYQEVQYILNIIKNIWNINKYKKYFNIDDNNNDNNLMEFLEEDIDENKHNNIVQLPYRRQTFIVSATLTLESINRNKLTESFSPIFSNLATLVPFQESIKIIDQTPRHRTTLNVSEYEIILDINDKDAMIIYLLLLYKNVGKILVFANTIGCVKRITLILKEFGYNNIYSLHSQQQQKQRLKNLDKFVQLNNCILICTDVCARGLDIMNINQIIHFQCPLSPEDYIHRVGRIGRHEYQQNNVAVDGNSFLLICANEMKLYNKIILALKKPQGLNKLNINERLFIQIKKQITIVKQIASLLNNKTKKNRKKSSLQKMADAAGIELDEINCRALNIMKTDNNLRNNKINQKKKYFKKNKHKSFEYGVNDDNYDVNKQIKSLRNQLKKLKRDDDLKTPKSSYLTKTYVD